MDFKFSEEQRLLKDAVRGFLNDNCPSDFVRAMEEDPRGYTEELWRAMAELGWMGLLLPEKYGGIGWTFLELTMMLEEMGRTNLPGPFLSTTLGAQAVLSLGDEDLCRVLLPRVAKGDLVLTLALQDASVVRFDPLQVLTKAAKGTQGWELNGSKLFVNDAHTADYIVVSARVGGKSDDPEGISLFLVEKNAPGLELMPLKTIAGDKQFEMKLRDTTAVVLGQPGSAWPALERLLQMGALAKCAEMVGGADRVLQITVEYAKDREQFGLAIGSFQAVQHHCANMFLDLEGSRYITYKAAWSFSQGLLSQMLVAAAKAFVSEAYRRVVSLGHQIGAATAYIVENDMPLYSRRAKAAELAFGDARYHRDQAVRALGL